MSSCAESRSRSISFSLSVRIVLSFPLRNMEPVWKIKISILKKDGKWMIGVQSDNGGGFPAKYLEGIFGKKKRRIFVSSGSKQELEDSRVEGMGIWNIYMRLMICYDNDFVFRLYNDEGAVVVIRGAFG